MELCGIRGFHGFDLPVFRYASYGLQFTIQRFGKCMGEVAWFYIGVIALRAGAISLP
jgi:hypothetical protein